MDKDGYMIAAMENNVRLYPTFQFFASFFAWLPIFFLYFNQYLSLSEVIQLGSVYYFFVCLWEVPSGYFSDRIGRRPTLIIAGFALMLAYIAFLASDDFAGFIVGQILIALGMAMMSGTDSAFLYDSLLGCDRADEYEKWEAKSQKMSSGSAAIAAILGGLLGLVELEYAYYLSLASAFIMVVIAWRFVEPVNETRQTTESPLKTLGQCIRHLKHPVLGWVFAVMALMYCLEHIAYEFYQPYIKLLNLRWLQQDSSTLVSGMVLSVSMIGGAVGAAYSVRLNQYFGVVRLLFIAFAIQLAIIAGLSQLLWPGILFIVMLRNFPMSMIHAPVNSVIAPLIGSHLRATYLSIQSLAARLLFSIVLYMLSSSISGSELLSWEELSQVLSYALVFGLAGCAFAWLFMPRSLGKKNYP